MRVTPSVAKRLTNLFIAVSALAFTGMIIAVLFAMWHATWAERLVMLLIMVPLIKVTFADVA